MDRRRQIQAVEWRLAVEAGRQWEVQQPGIDAVLRTLKSEGPSGADTPARVGKFLKRELNRTRVWSGFTHDPSALGLERRFGPTLDYEYIPPPEAQGVNASIGRLVEVASSGAVSAFATGFLVSPRLLMTNWHVFENAASDEGASVQFGYEYKGALLQAGVTFGLRPSEFFLSDKTHDYALVAVEGSNSLGHTLTPFGFTRLIPAEGKILVGHGVHMIGHPGGMPKTYVFRNNPLVSVEPTTLLYLTDSDEGASGSPAYNPVWELIALHHRSVPRTVGGRAVLKDGRGFWEEGMSTEDIDWIGNEGVRISVVASHLRATQGPDPHPLLAALLAEAIDPIGTEASETRGYRRWQNRFCPRLSQYSPPAPLR
jgi:endonuclease G, mitochondrial